MVLSSIRYSCHSYRLEIVSFRTHCSPRTCISSRGATINRASKKKKKINFRRRKLFDMFGMLYISAVSSELFLLEVYYTLFAIYIYI